MDPRNLDANGLKHRSAARKVGVLTIQGIFAFGPPNENLSPDC